MVEIRDVIMASGSKFRKALLAATGLEFYTESAQVDEQSIQGGTPEKTALHRAVAKAVEVAARKPHALVIGADQVLGLDGKEFGKVENKAAAIERLLMLAGKTHFLHSAYCLVIQDASALSAVSEKNFEPRLLHKEVISVPMTMRALTREEAAAYVDNTQEWQGVVGCYQYENRGINLFNVIGGDHSSIIGLPIIPLLTALRKMGINPLLNPRGPWHLVGE